MSALNDHTSGSGWGVIDLHGKRRPAFAALRSACKPVVVTIDVLPQVTPANGRLSVAVHVSSDLRHDIEGAVVDVAVWGTDSDQTHRFIGTIEADASSYIGTVTVIAPTVGQVSFIATLKTDYGTSEAMTSTEVR